MSLAILKGEKALSVIETDMLNGHNIIDRKEGVEDDQPESSRDPSRLPVKNLEAYKSWCQRVKDDWDPAEQ